MKRKNGKKNLIKKCANANNVNSGQNFPPIPYESTRCDSELKIIDFFDLSKEEDSSDEKENDKNDEVFGLNNLLLGKKRERENNKDNIVDKEKDKINKDEANISVNTEGPSINLNNDNFINKGRNVSDKQELINLVNKEGFNKIFNLISSTYFDRRNNIERKLDDIICNIGLLRTSLILLQIKFTQPGIQVEEPVANPHLSKIEEEFTKKSPENQIINNEEYELGEHFHKEKNGKIYKYNKHHFRVKNRISFNCADLKCKSRGLYFINNMKFRVMTSHSMPYDEHNYIKNKEKFNRHKAIFDDFKKRNCHEAQVFKNDIGDKLVKWYDN